jgi:glycosyltransferase involved in cell wall biosynthesis
LLKTLAQVLLQRDLNGYCPIDFIFFNPITKGQRARLIDQIENKFIMKVTIFSDFDHGLNPYILLFKKALEDQGLNVRFERNFDLSWLFTNGKSCDCIHLHWLTLFYTPLEKKNSSKFFVKLIKNRYIKALFDLLTLIDFSFTFLFSKLLGKNIVFTVHDLYDFGKKSLRRKLQLEIARRIVFLFANSIHVHNHFTRKLIETRYNRKTDIFVIPHGNYIGYYANQISRSEARRQLGLPDDAFVYLFLGLLRPYKGLEDLVDAFKKMDRPEARLLVAGKVFGVNSYASKLKNLSQADFRIKLVPEFIPDEAIQVYLNACDFFVLPYKDITTSGAAALALSFGRPIIAPSIASFPEVITSDSGILYDTSQPNALTSALQAAINWSSSESTILSYANQFDWDKLGTKLVALY